MLIVPEYTAYNFRINSAKVSDVSSLDHAGLTVKMNCTRIPVIISGIEDTAIDILGEEVFAGIRFCRNAGFTQRVIHVYFQPYKKHHLLFAVT